MEVTVKLFSALFLADWLGGWMEAQPLRIIIPFSLFKLYQPSKSSPSLHLTGLKQQ